MTGRPPSEFGVLPDLAEIEAFAADLSPDVGPMFGRDVSVLIQRLRDPEEIAQMYVGQNKDNLDGEDALILARSFLRAIGQERRPR